MAKAYVKRNNGNTVIELDGKIFHGACMTIPNVREGQVRVDGEYYRKLRAAGIRLFFVMCDLDFSGKRGYERFLEEMRVIMQSVPDCYVMLRIALHPSAEWVERHPNAVVRFSDGKTHPATIGQESGNVFCAGGAYALYSREWQRDASAALMEFLAKANKEPFADKIVGYFLGAGNNSEWHGVGINEVSLREGVPYYEFNEDFLSDFQGYLDEKYGAGVKTAKIPGNEEKHYIFTFDEEIAYRSLRPSTYEHVLQRIPTNGTSLGSFVDVDAHQNVVDFYMALGYAAAKGLLYFAQGVKKAYPDKLVGAFFGYTNGVHTSFNLAGLPLVLRSPYVDFCAAPNCYENRQLGGNEPVRSVRDSYGLYDKVFFAEEDTRTHLDPFIAKSSFGVYTEEDSIDILKRNFAKNLCGGNYWWWYDQQLGGGRFDSEGILDTFRRQSEILERAGSARWEKNNEVAFVFDVESRMACSDWTSHQSVSQMKNYVLGRIGTGYDDYLLDDVVTENAPDYKLYIFACVCDLTDGQREKIKRKLRKNHATALWLYGAGLMNPDAKEKTSCENVRRLTGFSVAMEYDTVYDGKLRPFGSHEIARGLEGRREYGGYDQPMFSHLNKNAFDMIPYLCPRFVVEDKEATALGLFCEGEGVAFAVKEYEGFTSVYCGVKYLQHDAIRSVAKFAGCHLYNEQGEVVYASSRYIAIHATTSGRKRLRFQQPCTLIELYENKEYVSVGTEIELDMLRGQTKTFEILR